MFYQRLWNHVVTVRTNWGHCPPQSSLPTNSKNKEKKKLGERHVLREGEWEEKKEKLVCIQLVWNRVMCLPLPHLPPTRSSSFLLSGPSRGATHRVMRSHDPLGGTSVIWSSGPCTNEGTPALVVYKYHHHCHQPHQHPHHHVYHHYHRQCHYQQPFTTSTSTTSTTITDFWINRPVKNVQTRAQVATTSSRIWILLMMLSSFLRQSCTHWLTSLAFLLKKLHY